MFEYFNKTINTQRLVNELEESPESLESPEDTEEYRLYLENIPCQIQPLEDSFGEDISGSYGKDFLMFCGVCDIKEKDKIIDGELEYIVNGVEEYNFLGKSHMELRIRLTK